MKEVALPIVKISKQYQITIPKKLRGSHNLDAGKYVEILPEKSGLVVKPVKSTETEQDNTDKIGKTTKQAIPRLNQKEQKLLMKAKQKIHKINTDLPHSKGLNNEEIKVAVKAGLIEEDQAYWWHEDWQKGEREAEKSIQRREGVGSFNNAEDAIDALKNAKI